MATSTTPQPYTADRPENSTTSVDANNDLPDELWTKINVEFYRDTTDAVFKALVE
jgi:predicted ATP-dependent Lon-type protease